MKKHLKKIAIALITALILSMPCFCLSKTADYLNGVWLSTVSNIDFPSSQSLTESQLKAELDDVVNNCKTAGINAIFFQVRPSSDALYKSDIFPWSRVLTGTEGKAPQNNFDPLKYLLSLCKSNNIELHAWINPYRVCKTDKLNTLSKSNPAYKNPNYTVSCSDGYTYYNPALKQVRDLITDGVLEIVKNYDIDGIHFDDYFYPYNVDDYPDQADYQKYGSKFKSVADFRRNNVNQLVKQVKTAIKKANKNVQFGISPFGIWDNKSQNSNGSNTSGMSSYSQIYCDSRAWVKNGWVDYICPQIYWSTTNEVAPFKTLVNWWSDLTSKTDVKLYIGHAFYKLGNDDEFNSISQIQEQLAYCKSNSEVKGSVFFSYQNIKQNTLGCSDVISSNDYKVSSPPVYTATELIITSEQSSTTAQNISVSGVANPNYTLTVNKTPLKVSKNGYFCAYLNLNLGKNTFTFINDTQQKTITITRTNATQPQPNAVINESSIFPYGECEFMSNQNVTLTVKAQPNIQVFATLNNVQTELLPKQTSDNICEYSATITMPTVLFNNQYYGKLTYHAIKDGKTINISKTADITVLSAPKTMYAKQDSYVYNSTFGGSMMDNCQIIESSACKVVSLANGMYQLSSGKWVDNASLTLEFVKKSLDIDKSKYKTVKISSKTPFETYAQVSDGGQLLLKTYGSQNIKITNKNNVNLSKITNDSITFFNVGGFYLEQLSDTELLVYVYNKNHSGTKTVVIDAGHGGSDIGAVGPPGKLGATESQLNLSISLMVANKLKQKGYNVVLTRADDSAVLLNDRTKLIRGAYPDLCVSIHHNSVGAESDYNKPNGALILYSQNVSNNLAQSVSGCINANLEIKNEGARMQSLKVCREYRFSSILIECGYVCNPEQYELLQTDAFKQQICNNIVQGICDYFAKTC